MSSLCFWGDSKFLDNREDLILDLFPELENKIKPRPIIITVYIPINFTKVLFIENQDSFLALVEQANKYHELSSLALVYSAGFRGSASRIRQPGNAIFTTINAVDTLSKKYFEQWWFEYNESTVNLLSCFFWGDFDYSGMGILSALRKKFITLKAWHPGYVSMLAYLDQGIGHTLQEAGKSEQKDPGEVGCDYSDSTLLPYMREHNLFLDQEAVDVVECLKW